MILNNSYREMKDKLISTTLSVYVLVLAIIKEGSFVVLSHISRNLESMTNQMYQNRWAVSIFTKLSVTNPVRIIIILLLISLVFLPF
jgi:hypothetical protein